MKLLYVTSWHLLALFPSFLCMSHSTTRNENYNSISQEAISDATCNTSALENSQNSKSCPTLYQRFSKEHTYCKKSTCNIIAEGVSAEDKKTILEIHNTLRSKLANGTEDRCHRLPSAANMMELEWDEELARVAQAHASLCLFEHDDNNGRGVENFPVVGQNLLQAGSAPKDWGKISAWYENEVCVYNPDVISSFSFEKKYGHFSQVTWAKTWKVGCGFAAYNGAEGTRSLYTCNYGPGGNAREQPQYIKGKPCSQCPKNTKCSKKYPGLCKSITEEGPQIQRPSSEDYIFFCDFSDNDPKKCSNVKISGNHSFCTRHVYDGNYKTTVLNGGEWIEIDLGWAQNKGGICPFLYTRVGPNNAAHKESSALILKFRLDNTDYPYQLSQVDDSQKNSFNIRGTHMMFNGHLKAYEMKIFQYIFIGVASGIMNAVAEFSDDASSVTWAHAVNSRKDLEEALAGEVNFLEADISLGNVTGPNPEFMVPIMAHPPSDTSDISLATWIREVISAKRNKGVKLDFKFLEIVEGSLKILRRHEDKITFPLWLNADILPGPVDPTTTPVNSTQFLSLCHQYFPQATLSIGWTTRPNNQSVPGSYTWKNVKDMAESLECSEANQPLTFPVRAIFVSSSFNQLIWLLDIFPTSTLTIWSAVFDSVDVDSLLKLRSLTSISRVYYDLPGKLNQQFHDRKDSIQPIVRLPGFVSYNYTVFGGDKSCTDKVYVTPSAVLFTGQKRGVVFHRIFSPMEKVQLNGKVYFLNDTSLATSFRLFVSKADSFPNDSRGNIIIPPAVDILAAIENSTMFSYTFSNSSNNLLFMFHFTLYNGTLSIIVGEDLTTVNCGYKQNAIVAFISEGGPSVIYDGEFTTSEISDSDCSRPSIYLLVVLLAFLYTLYCSLPSY